MPYLGRVGAYHRARRRVFDTLDSTAEGGRAGRISGIFLTVLISFNVLAVVLASVASLQSRFGMVFRAFEVAFAYYCPVQ